MTEFFIIDITRTKGANSLVLEHNYCDGYTIFQDSLKDQTFITTTNMTLPNLIQPDPGD